VLQTEAKLVANQIVLVLTSNNSQSTKRKVKVLLKIRLTKHSKNNIKQNLKRKIEFQQDVDSDNREGSVVIGLMAIIVVWIRVTRPALDQDNHTYSS
jgi:hypothetical protein